jgi:hypothetical protein
MMQAVMTFSRIATGEKLERIYRRMQKALEFARISASFSNGRSDFSHNANAPKIAVQNFRA